MNKMLICNIVFLIVLTIWVGCEDEEADLRLRNSENEVYYWENNKLAAQRFATIMYRHDGRRTERFKMVHISDSHLSSWSFSNNYKLPINLLQSVKFANQQELKINTIVATGDLISNGKKEEAIDYMRSFVSNFYMENYIPSFLCTGNHDSNSIDYIKNSFLYKNEVNRIMFSATNYRINRPFGENYYYSDVPDPQGGVMRIISLDMLDQTASEYNTLFYASFSQAQVDWLAEVALKEGMTDRHSVIILSHYPFQCYDQNATTYLCDGDFVHSWNMIPEIVEAFRTHSSLNKNYPNKLNKNDSIHVNFDFSGCQGEFVCYLGGHAHCSAYFNVIGLSNESSNFQPQKMLLCTNQAPSESGVIYNRVVRKEGSTSSNCFSIYAIDTKEKNIYVTFFGAYKPSNDQDYPGVFSIPYL